MAKAANSSLVEDTTAANRNALDLVRLRSIMAITSGAPGVVVAVLDGPVFVSHPDLRGATLQVLNADSQPYMPSRNGAYAHGTSVVGILAAGRNSLAPAICPNCTFLLRPIFSGPDDPGGEAQVSAVTSADLGLAIAECVDSGARVINLSLGLAPTPGSSPIVLLEALDYAAERGAIVVAAAGNQGDVGASAITRYPWVIPVVAYNLRGRPIPRSNLGSSIGRRGLGAPGEGIVSLSPDGRSTVCGGTSVATAFVTGAIALLWSRFTSATAAEMRVAIGEAAAASPRRGVVPPLLDAEAAYGTLERIPGGRCQA